MEYPVLVLAFVCADAARRRYNCRHAPVPRYGDDIAELEIPPQCFGGIIVWRYPADIAVNTSIFQLFVDFLARLRSVVCHCFLSGRLTYPGYLHLMSEKLAGYSLCIQENWKTFMGNLRVVSIHGLQQIPVPLPDNLSCVHDRFGIAEMVVMARPIMSDTVSFAYRVIKYDFT